MAKFCIYCGAALAPGAKMCAACGRPVAQLPGFAPENGAAARPAGEAHEALMPAPPKAVFAAEGALAPAAGEKDAQTPAPPAAPAAGEKDAAQEQADAAQSGAPQAPAAKAARSAPADAPGKPAAQPGAPAREEASAAPAAVPPAPSAPSEPAAPAPTPVPLPRVPQTVLDRVRAQLGEAEPAPGELPSPGAQTPPPAGETPDAQPKYAPVGPALRPSAQGAGITTGGVLSMLLLALLPVAGWVLMLVWAFDSQSSEARRCVAKGILLFKLIAAAVVLVLALLLAALSWQAFAWGGGYGGPHRYW